MNRIIHWVTLAILFSCLCSVSDLRAQSDPVLTARTKTGETSFHVGERIPLELSFTSSSVNRYEINLAGYDRSGRLQSEQFEVSPQAGWVDPLAGYFGNGRIGGGISSSAVLSNKPELIELNLNEWVRFDQPGDYEVVIRSSRVSEPKTRNHVELRSGALKLHITPSTPEWQKQQLSTALATLHAVPETQGVTADARKDAIADIRYLRSKEATRVMAAGVRDDRQDELYAFAFGLIGLPNSLRDEAVQAMQAQIDDLAFPISGWFITVEAELLNGSESTSNQEEATRFRELAWRKCLASLPSKSGKARAITAETLLNQPPHEIDSQDKAQLAAVLSTAFLDLSPELQTSALVSHWDLLRSDAMESTLRKLAELPLADPANNLTTIYVTRRLKAAALARWYDLNPAEATRAAMQQVGSASPSLTESDLVFLGDRKMPEFEAIWADALLKEPSYTKEAALAGLLARFGDGSALPSVIDKLSNKVGHWACAPQSAALAYVVEFDPERARGLLKRAVAARGEGYTACNHAVFQGLTMYTSGPVATDVAIEAINDRDPQVAMDALIYLMYYGDKRAKEPIWNRYVRWTEVWSGKADALESREAGDPAGNWLQRGLGENLATALIANQGWLADKELIEQVLERCVGEQMCARMKQLAASSKPPYRVGLYRSGRTENDTVAQYTEKSEALLEAKLAQFPRGTRFMLVPNSFSSPELKTVESHVKALFEKAGMSLVLEQKHP